MLPEQDRIFTQGELRREYLASRNGLSRREQEEKSLKITDRLWRLEEFKAGRTVMFYASFRSEVRTAAAIARALAAGVRVVLPRTEPGSRLLLPYLVEDPALDLRPGYCGIPEPDPIRTRPVSPDSIEAVVVPGSVFDARGGRLGYGGGYYDRFLALKAPQARRIGLAFELQVAPGVLPLTAHDQLLHCLVTEERTIVLADLKGREQQLR
jgi:5-formyltetrahydrofolate cyclo-ligase